MSEQELVTAFRAGRIGRVAFFRRLLKAGLSVGAAIALATATAPSAQADECTFNCVCDVECLGANPAANNVANAGAMLLNVSKNVGAAPMGLDNVALNTANAGNHLLNIAANLPNTGTLNKGGR